jgi:hypothetical protein
MGDRTRKITFRLSPEEHGEIMRAIKASPEPWRGMSHHIHFVVLTWAHRVLADQLAFEMKNKAAARKVRHGKMRKAAGS